MIQPPMRYSQGLLSFIQGEEGLSLKAYEDHGLAIGYGSHVPGIDGDTTCTQIQALFWLIQKLDEICKGINNLVNVSLAQCQFDALCSFCYNLGVGAFEGSTMLRLLNEGAYGLAAAEFPRWDKIHDDQGNVVVSADLRTRRLKEQAMFLNKPYVEEVKG